MTVSVCGVNYKIEYVDVIDESCEGIVHGEIDYTKGIIRIKNGLPKDIERQVIIHEIVHGILFNVGKSKMTEDEEFVQLLAVGIFTSGFDIRIEEND